MSEVAGIAHNKIKIAITIVQLLNFLKKLVFGTGWAWYKSAVFISTSLLEVRII